MTREDKITFYLTSVSQKKNSNTSTVSAREL